MKAMWNNQVIAESEDIINVEVPFAGIIEYEFDKLLNLKKKETL